MSNSNPLDSSLEKLSRERLAVLVKSLQKRLREQEQDQAEPIAIVGAACRFPGAPDLDAYWELLRAGRDAVSTIPEGRWDVDAHFDPNPETPGKMYTKSGGFIEDPTRFDPSFFGISRREAISMDPQQRLLLEIAWETLESAGAPASRLRESNTGVFVGISTNDHLQLGCVHKEREQIDAYYGTGSAASIAAGRIAYLLGLQGPTMAIDTACSSSLVALHLACNAIRNRECESALVGGVNLMLSPDSTIYFCRVRALSAEGRCKTFSASADGYVRGEGCGFVMLKRLSTAIEDKDNILALVRGTAVNHDGRTTGLTVPNTTSQVKLLQAALRNASLQPNDVSYIEAHGTGTPLGDPIELNALAKVYGASPQRVAPLRIGSAKTNIGHLEAAAGVAGLLKVILSMRHQEIPASLHFDQPNPNFDWQSSKLSVVESPTPWSDSNRVATVSSFGFSGTNANVVLQASDEFQPTRPKAPQGFQDRSAHLVCLSAKSENAVREFAGACVRRWNKSHPSIGDLGYSLNAKREHYAYRRALVTHDSASLLEQLSAIADGQQSISKAGSAPLRIGFLFTGQGAQYAGMGRDLYDSSPTFREALEQCASLWLRRYPSETPLLELMFGEDDKLLQQTRYTQPCLFAFEYALAELWRSWGVRPTLVMGHSVGEITAACHAGLITLEMALEFAAERGRLMWNLPAGGSMVAVRASADQAESWLPSFPNVSLAADNGPQSIVLSGLESELHPLLQQLQSNAVPYQPLQVSHAFHSKQLDPVLDQLAELTATWQYSAPDAIFVSNLMGAPIQHDQIPETYWADHARNCVKFRQGIDEILNADVDVCIEIGPQPTLSSMAMRCENASSIQWLPSMRRQGDCWEHLCKTLGAVYEAGADVDWASFDQPYTRKFIGYPQYPFQRVALKADVDFPQKLSRRTPLSKPTGLPTTEIIPKPDITASENAVASNPMSPVFELTWEERPLDNMSTAVGGSWLIVGQGQIADQLLQRLQPQASQVQQLDLATLVAEAPANNEAAQDSELVAQIKARCEGFQNIDGIVFCPSLDCESLQDGLPRALHDLLFMVQAVASSGQELSRRFWVLTRGASSWQADSLEVGAATIWGLMRTVGVESRQLHSICVDFGLSESAESTVTSTLNLLRARDHEAHIAMRGDKRFVQRLQPVYTATELDRESARTDASIRSDASYLVTGGLGGVGVRLALWLCKQGAGQVHLASRKQPDSDLEHGLRQAAMDGGSNISFHVADVGEQEDVAQLVARIQSGRFPLDGVFHLAGAHRDAALVNLSWEDFLFTARSKVQGTLHLHQATEELPLSHFVVFSSVASVVGSPGQANYAAANAFMDALMEQRRQRGLPGLTLNWGPWDEVGMAAQLSSSKKRRWETMGVSLIRPEQGIELVAELLSAASSQYVVMPVDWSKMLCLFPPGLEPPLLAKFIDPHRRLGESSPQWRELKRNALQLPQKRRPELVARFVESMVRDVMEVPAEEEIDRNSGFADLGMDSLMGVELRNHLQLHLGSELTLSATVAFNYPNISSLSGYLAREQFQESESKPQVRSEQVSQSHDDDPIAIVGCAMRFPGGIVDLDGYWDVLRAGASAVEEIPATRWNVDDYFDPDPDRPGYMNTRWAGVMDDLDRFDAAFFGISPREAAKMDPQHRIVLETVWSALEQACIPPSSLYGTKAAMFLGISGNDYVSRLSRCSPREDIDAYLAAGNAQHIAAGRVSHFFGLHGPSIALDTACSSSLVAVHLAHESLRCGESDLAIAGGVNVLLAPEITISLSKAHMMAKDGQCKTFSDEADGYVRSEGCGLVLLKRLSDAQRDGNRILAVLRGSCVNHDGRCSAVTVPNGDSQQALIRGALQNASLHPDHLSYVETHGTGTSLGDPIEIDALSQVFSERSAEDRLVLGSVKANLGHLESAAGIAGVLKVLAMLRHDQFPPQPPINRLNSHVDWERAPVQVSRTLQPWPKDSQVGRFAGVSSFSFGGTNAHVVLADAPQNDAVNYQIKDDGQESQEHLFVLSAKTAAALERRMELLTGVLDHQDPADLAFTLAAGRDHFNHRAAIVASSTQQLKSTLAEYLAQGGHSRVALRSNSASSASDIGLLLTNLAAYDAGQAEYLLRYCPQIASDVDAQMLECQELIGRATTTTQSNAVQWTVLQAVLAQHALRWFPQALTVAGIGIGRFAALAASGMLSIREAAELSFTQIFASEQLLETAQQMLALCEAGEGEELWDLDSAASLRRVSIARLNELEHDARQQGQVFSRLGAEFLDLVDVRETPRFVETASSMDWKRAEQAVMDLGTGDFISGATNVFASRGLPIGRRGVSDLLGGDGGLVLSTATKAWELEHGIPSLAARGCIQLSNRSLPPLLQWMYEAYLAGGAIEWREFLGSGHRWLDLPTYPFARDRFWFDETAETGIVHRAVDLEQHPYVGTRRRGPTIKDTLFENRLAPFSPALLQDHKIYDMVVVPGAFHLSAVLAASQIEKQHSVELEEVVFPEALVLQDNADRSYQLCFSPLPPGQIGFQTFRVFSELPGSDRWSLHCEGKRSTGTTDSGSTPKSVDLEALRGKFEELAIERDWFYNMMSQLGIQLGEQFRWLQSIQRAEGSALARVTAPPTADQDDSILHPGLIDGCFQILAACVDLKDHQNNAYIPVKVRHMRVFRWFGTSGWLSAKLSPTAVDASSFEGDLVLLDDAGEVIAELSGVTVRKAPRSTLAGFAQRQSTDIFYKIGWIERELPISSEENSTTQPAETSAAPEEETVDTSAHQDQLDLPWLVVADDASPQSDLAKQLSGIPTIQVGRRKDGSTSTCLPSLLDEFTSLDARCCGVVWTPLLVPAALESAPEKLLGDLRSCYAELLEVVQFLGRQKLPPEFHLVLVTNQGLPVDNQKALEPALQMLSGFSQVIRSEFPQLRCTHVDLEDASLESTQNLAKELNSIAAGHHDGERVIAFRNQQRWIPRLVRALARQRDENNAVGSELDLSVPYRLEPNESGILSALSVARLSRTEPGPGQIEIQVQATGLNFRDVLNALSLYPGDPGPLGVECAGIVTALGAGVEGPMVGTRVVALAPGSFSQYVLTSSHLVAEIPEHMSDAEAAAVPVTHLTADAALRQLAKLTPNDSVLIHAGTGGVGQAAVDIALRVGATVYATAGTEEKRNLLKEKGVQAVLDSRSTSFAEELLRLRNGQKVDVVLNSLSGKMIDASFQVLSPTGRFVEIGKIGIRSQESVAQSHPSVQYFIYALDDLAARVPKAVGQALRGLMQEFQEHQLSTPRIKTFEMKQAKEAFQFMAQAKHVGKIVVTHPSPQSTNEDVQSTAGYLITGGLGGAGLVVARWLAERGAGRIVLMSRSAPSAAVLELLEELQTQCDVRVVSADVSDWDAVQKLGDEFDESMPLKGVIHAAGVLEDGPLAQLTWDRFVPVLSPKVLGALNLHRLTKDRDLDFFVMFSSIASVLGSPGQGNYATANAFLDGLAHYRHAQQLPALSINWGPWKDVGMAAQVNPLVIQQWEKSGLLLLETSQCLAALEQLLSSQEAQAIVTATDWSRMGQQFAMGNEPSLLRDLLSNQRAHAGPSERWLKLIAQIEKAPVPQRLDLLIQFMCDEARSVLNLPVEQEIDPGLPFNEYGFDSLMAVELANRLAAESGTSLPATLLFDHPTLKSLATYILTDVYELLPKEAPEPAPVRRKSVDELTTDLLAEIESMSDDEIQDHLS